MSRFLLGVLGLAIAGFASTVSFIGIALHQGEGFDIGSLTLWLGFALMLAGLGLLALAIGGTCV